MSVINALESAEEALGNNLVWLADALDLRIRQKDPETLRRLQELNSAWVSICKALAEARRGITP